MREIGDFSYSGNVNSTTTAGEVSTEIIPSQSAIYTLNVVQRIRYPQLAEFLMTRDWNRITES